MINFQSATFLLSAERLEHLPPDQGMEVAIAGRSNAGKSTLLNVLCQQRHLARVSKTPGRTQLMNVFKLTETARLVDLPGYGFAQVPLAIKQRWGENLCQYLEQRDSLKGVILLMDIRHPLKVLDRAMIDWAVASHLPLHIVLTKADKLSRQIQRTTLQTVTKVLMEIAPDLCSVQVFSATSRLGLDLLKDKMNVWFGAC